MIKNSSESRFGIQSIIEDYYAPLLFKPAVRIFVVVIFVAWLASSLVVLPHIEVGLEQVRPNLVTSSITNLRLYITKPLLEQRTNDNPNITTIILGAIHAG